MLSSCSATEPIVGKWQWSGSDWDMGYGVTGHATTLEKSNWEFKADGTVIWGHDDGTSSPFYWEKYSDEPIEMDGETYHVYMIKSADIDLFPVIASDATMYILYLYSERPDELDYFIQDQDLFERTKALDVYSRA